MEPIGARSGESCAPGTNEVLSAMVRQVMADCRARLAAEDAARELVGDGQEAEGDVVERAAAD